MRPILTLIAIVAIVLFSCVFTAQPTQATDAIVFSDVCGAGGHVDNFAFSRGYSVNVRSVYYGNRGLSFRDIERLRIQQARQAAIQRELARQAAIDRAIAREQFRQASFRRSGFNRGFNGGRAVGVLDSIGNTAVNLAFIRAVFR